MQDLIAQSSASLPRLPGEALLPLPAPIPLPAPRRPIAVRTATLADLPFIDDLQKRHTKQVGWMPTSQLEAKIGRGQVLIAEEVPSCELLVASGDAAPLSSLPTNNSQQTTHQIGYCIGTDQYFKRDDVGIIYQMNVAPGHRRGLVGATLLRAMFDRAAYGCRLFCCWCAQDIEANRFWEAMGFVPLAFRTGSAKRGRGGGRVHIFWQRRIRAGDVTTPYWFPAQTSAGSIREDRLVLPIPPGTSWRDVMPVILPTAGVPTVEADSATEEERTPRIADRTIRKTKRTPEPRSPRETSKIVLGGLRFAPVPSPSTAPRATPKAEQEPKPEPKPKAPRVKVKNDPKHVAAARELRDRWLERVNADPSVLLSQGKYDVTRTIAAPRAEPTAFAAPLLEHRAA